MDKKLVQKLLILSLLLCAVIAFLALDLEQYLTFAYLKSSQSHLREIYIGHKSAFIFSYMAVYIIVTALSLPGATIMSLAGAAIFGFWIALVVVSFASSIGATMACFVSRFLLREWVQSKFGDKLKTVNEGMAREGGFYLFALRLVPAFPFFIINLVMGLTRMRLLTFYWVSQLGMLPGTAAYVNAGKELGKIDSPAGILSPALIISFVILGLFPITIKKLLALYKSKYRIDRSKYRIDRSTDQIDS